MPTEKEIDLEARLAAIENVVVHMAAFSFGLVPAEVIRRATIISGSIFGA